MGFLIVAQMVLVKDQPWEFAHTEWWYWMAWAVVTTYIGSSLMFPHYIGLASYFVLILAGKLSMSLISDNYGFLRVHIIPATPLKIVGCLVTVAGAFFISLSKSH